MISNDNYEDYDATPGCFLAGMCLNHCPWYEDCWPDEEEEDEDFFYY